MTEEHSSPTGPVKSAASNPGYWPAEIAASLRVPVMLLMTSAAVWLLIGSMLALIGSIKFHSPNFLGDIPWLSYGRVRAAWLDSLVYGFCLQAGLGSVLWLVARLGQRTLVAGSAAFAGGVFWNLGLTIAIPGILAGDSTGFENIEIPAYAMVLLFIGWALIGLSAVLTFHYRLRRPVYVSLWFFLAALFWFPWIYSTACLLLVSYPVRGIAQAVIVWWYSQNLVDICLSMFGLGAAFYLVPRLTGRPLRSRYLALFSFWVLILFTSWGGIPANAPVPAWMPAASQISDLLTLVLLCAAALNIYQTRWFATPAEPKPGSVLPDAAVPLRFVLVGTGSFVLAGIMRFSASWLDPVHLLEYTWFSHARLVLQVYGFLGMVLFGGAYHFLPLVAGTAWCWPRLVRTHFWLAVTGIVLVALPFAVGGLLQAAQFDHPNIPFMTTVKVSMHFLRLTTVGELLLLAGHALFFVNIVGLLRQLYRSHVVPVYETATEDLFHMAEGKA